MTHIYYNVTQLKKKSAFPFMSLQLFIMTPTTE